MGLPAPILSGPSILYLGLAAHKYSNKVHLSMLLLEEMLWMKWREHRPHSHTQRGTDKYTETFTITHLSSTALLPWLWLSAVFWLDSSPLTYSISQGCCGQIGRLVVWLPPPSMLAEDSFIKKMSNRYTLTLAHKIYCMCADKHDGTHTHRYCMVWLSRLTRSLGLMWSGLPCGHLSRVFYSQLISNSMKHDKNIKE